MSSWQMVRLVAGRELAVRLTSKVFLLSTLGLVAAIMVGGVLLKIAGDTDPLEVGFTPETSELSSTVAALAGQKDGSEAIRTTQVSAAEGRQQVRDGDLDALVTGTPTGLEVVVDNDLDAGLESVLTAVAQQQALTAEIRDLGGDPEKIAAEVADSAPTVTALDPDEVEPAQVVAGYLVGILIFLGLMTTGQLVAQGVVEEKTSRVVELLLAAVRPWQLMAGKVLGIGIVGLVQVLAIIAASVATTSVLGLLDPGALNLGLTALGALGWFVVGYLTYALALAALASLVSRQEEVGSVISPVMTIMVVPYIVAVSIGTWQPDNPLVVALSYIPFCAPLVMPVRIAGGDVATWEVLLSLGLSLALIPILVRVAGRMYSNSVLQTGRRVRIRQALHR